jgi:hypothetical protein
VDLTLAPETAAPEGSVMVPLMVPRKVWDSDGKERIVNSETNVKNVRRNAFVNMNDLLQSEANGMVSGQHGRTQINHG